MKLVQDLMQKEVLTIRRDKRLAIGDEIMKWAGIRHVPVVDRDQRVVGIVTRSDLLRVSLSTIVTTIARAERHQHLTLIDVEQVMCHPVHTIGPRDPLQLAAHVMWTEKVGCLPVVDDGRLVGILTESDLLQFVEHGGSHVESEHAPPTL